MPDLTPMTRQEKFLNGDTDLTPITRREHFYAGTESTLPEPDPITREEWFIKKYREAGDVTVEEITITENGTTTAPSGKAYSPVNVNVPLPQNAYLKKSAESYPITPSQLPLPKAEVAFSGDKAELYVGSEPIVVTDDNKPYLYRPSPSGKSCVDLSVVGGTVAWNQLVQNTDTSCTVPNNHKYIFHHGTTYDVVISDGNAFTVDGSANDNVHDITQAFGSAIADYVYSLEQATEGSGIAWLKANGFFTKNYYAYQSGKLESVNVASRKVVGKNLFYMTNDNKLNAYLGSTKIESANNHTCYYFPCLPNINYTISKIATDTNGRMGIAYTYEEPQINTSIYGVRTKSGDFVVGQKASLTTTTDANAKYIVVWAYWAYGSDEASKDSIQLELGSTATAYETYTSTTYPLDSNLTLRGIPKLSNGNLYYDGDIYESDGSVKRKYGVRAYESGDESLADAITDGTNTVYKLTTPTTESAQPFTNPQLVGSIEEFVDAGTSASTPTRDVDIPVGQDSKYVNGDIYISYGTSPIDLAKEHSIVPYATTYIDSNGTEDIEYWDKEE